VVKTLGPLCPAARTQTQNNELGSFHLMPHHHHHHHFHHVINHPTDLSPAYLGFTHVTLTQLESVLFSVAHRCRGQKADSWRTYLYQVWRGLHPNPTLPRVGATSHFPLKATNYSTARWVRSWQPTGWACGHKKV
jgi:hypothetical protein